jgi:phosphatidylglycerol:prolipoprotein diacylglycerol transferase
VHPIAFNLGGFTVHWYGVLVAMGFLLGLWTASRRGVRQGIAPEKILDAGIWIIAGAVIGARILYVLTYWDRLMANPTYPRMPWTEIFMIQKGGLVFYGGLIGSSLATLLFVWKNRLPLWRFADALAPSIALGYVPGRLGCLMNGCCYGKPTGLPWGIHFPAGHDAHGFGVHPTQVYDALLSLAVYLALAWLYRHRRFEGQIFAAYLLCYAVTRSTVEAFRGDYSQHYLGGIATPAHLVSMVVFVTGAVLYWKLSRGRPATPGLPPPPPDNVRAS